MRQKLEVYFEFARLKTNWRTEAFAGLTTFITMAYIIVVNPSILAKAGLPIAAVTVATCISAAFGSILMGVVALFIFCAGLACTIPAMRAISIDPMQALRTE